MTPREPEQAPIDTPEAEAAERLVVRSGPFKGRVYERRNGQLVRIDDGLGHTRGGVFKYDGKGELVRVRT